MKAKGKEFPNVFEQKKGKRSYIYTKNCYPGEIHFGEDVIKQNGEEYRRWDPTRSKLGAAILKGIKHTGIREGGVVLYLGSGHGFTPTYVSDMLGPDGMVFCLDTSPRVLQDLIPLCERRENMAPILADANKPETYEKLVPEKVDVIFQDVSQKNQVEIFLKNIDKYLKEGGVAMMALKAPSIDVTRNSGEIFNEVKQELSEKLKITDYTQLRPFEKDHAFFVCRK